MRQKNTLPEIIYSMKGQIQYKHKHCLEKNPKKWKINLIVFIFSGPWSRWVMEPIFSTQMGVPGPIPKMRNFVSLIFWGSSCNKFYHNNLYTDNFKVNVFISDCKANFGQFNFFPTLSTVLNTMIDQTIVFKTVESVGKKFKLTKFYFFAIRKKCIQKARCELDQQPHLCAENWFRDPPGPAPQNPVGLGSKVAPQHPVGFGSKVGGSRVETPFFCIYFSSKQPHPGFLKPPEEEVWGFLRFWSGNRIQIGLLNGFVFQKKSTTQHNKARKKESYFSILYCFSQSWISWTQEFAAGENLLKTKNRREKKRKEIGEPQVRADLLVSDNDTGCSGEMT
ncbi:hypothetical protein VP01_564g3 [Puccinia sorghi]|uniref:Uncharacterized protein n=1 Tax=Puccinia sorghi TaxID=27349 RepID=A0A0L6UIV7_9BASI|nr:hypothetical protein VP01_564g3 [Puccinia sorghi]